MPISPVVRSTEPASICGSSQQWNDRKSSLARFRKEGWPIARYPAVRQLSLRPVPNEVINDVEIADPFMWWRIDKNEFGVDIATQTMIWYREVREDICIDDPEGCVAEYR